MTLVLSLHLASLHRCLRAGLFAGALASAGLAAPQVWGEQIGTSVVDVVYGLSADGAGGSFECGSFQGDLYGFDITPGDAFVTRRDALGNALWTKLVATSSVLSCRSDWSDSNGANLHPENERMSDRTAAPGRGDC